MSKPLVSISLLCSNRKNTIRKCLDSLQPLRDAVSTELIIVDTGCDKETRAILEEYTDQIVDFEWCKDFSKARNAGLQKCRGEWFLYIDDDEWFIDMEEIIDFFLSGEHKKYHHAMYIQRNYWDYEERAYDDAWVSRMVRIEKNTRFVSSIHEFFTPAIGKAAVLHSAVKHFGYIFDSKEAKYRHSERNVSLLWDMIKKEYECTRWWVHLIQEYFNLGEYNKLMDVCDEALEVCKKTDTFITRRDRGAFYLGKIRAANGLYQIDKAKIFYEEAIKDTFLLPVSKGALYQVGAQIYYSSNDVEKCKECGQRCIEIYDKYTKEEHELLRQITTFVKDEYEERVHCSLLSVMVSVYLKEENFEEALCCFQKMNWKNGKKGIHENFILDIVNSFAKYGCNDVLIEIAQTLIAHKSIGSAIITEIRKREKLERIPEIFSQVESENYYISYLKILYADQINDSTYLQKYYEKIFSCVGDVLNFNDKFWEIAKKYCVDLDSLVINIPFDQWKEGVNRFCERNSMEMIQKRFDILREMQQTLNIRYDYFELKVSEAILVYAGKSYSEDELSETLNFNKEQKSTNKNQEFFKLEENYYSCRAKIYDFVEKSILFHQKFFTETAFEGEMEMLPASCRVAVKLYDALAQEENGDYRQVLEELKAIIGVFPPLDGIIQKYSKLYGKEVVKQQSSKTVSLELLKLAKQLQQKAQEFLDVGDVENAEIILKQITMYLPR